MASATAGTECLTYPQGPAFSVLSGSSYHTYPPLYSVHFNPTSLSTHQRGQGHPLAAPSYGALSPGLIHDWLLTTIRISAQAFSSIIPLMTISKAPAITPIMFFLILLLYFLGSWLSLPEIILCIFFPSRNQNPC